MKRKKPKNKAAQALAKKRHASLSKERRVEIARHAAAVRWAGHVPELTLKSAFRDTSNDGGYVQ
jgi:hypothetical protein